MTTTTTPVYPRELEADVVLRDGSTVHVRPARREDAPAIRAFLAGLSREAIGFRFFGAPDVDWVVNWSVDVDYADEFALVALSGSPSTIIAHGAYARIDDARAEVAFVVADAWQGQGISTVMLGQLASIAEQHGISTFTASVMPSNHRMIEVFRESGFPVEMRSRPDEIEVELPTSLSADGLARFHERERTAAVAAVRKFLEPRSVAVLGASRRRGTVGGELLHNLLSSDFTGVVYPINPHADVVHAMPAYPSIRDVPERVDLAIVVVPAEQVVAAARDCAAAGVRALLVISAGFSEAGPEGAARQRELVSTCRDAGIRIVGPNCLGVLNTAAQVNLNATFAPHRASPGRVGFMSQSGGVGIAMIEAASRLGVGLSSFVSAGNKADLSGNDLLQYWEQDPGTDLGLMYLESFGHPRKFARIAPRFARHKPLLAVKSGRSSAGARATSSHTGALLSASDVTIDALFAQAGVIRTDTLADLFSVAAFLTSQPVPRGDRVAIVTNAGGPGILCADACQADGVDVPELAGDVQAKLAEFLPAAASAANPVDMLASASADDYLRVIQTLVDARACDAVLAIFVPALATHAADVARAIHDVSMQAPEVPIAAVFMTAAGLPAQLRSHQARVPGYEFPEDAARAVALAARYGRWRARPPQAPPTLSGIDADRAAAVISRELARDAGWLSPAAVVDLLQCYALPLVDTRVVADAEQAVAAAAELGGPVALKASAAGLVHKSDAGGVELGLDGADAVREAAHRIEAAVAANGLRLDSFIVQRMAPPGVELIVGVVNDRHFGPVLACGGGGTTAELIGDIAVRITPISEQDAADMLRSLRTYPLLRGYRGAKRCDLPAIERVLLRVSALVETHPEIVELDCNPLVAGPDGAVIVDARIRVQTAPPPAPMGSLRAD